MAGLPKTCLVLPVCVITQVLLPIQDREDLVKAVYLLSEVQDLPVAL